MNTRHTYPPGYEPETGVLRPRYCDEAWKILDVLPVGLLSDVQRSYLAGLISGAIDHCVLDALAGNPLPLQGGERPM